MKYVIATSAFYWTFVNCTLACSPRTSAASVDTKVLVEVSADYVLYLLNFKQAQNGPKVNLREKANKNMY